MRPPYQPTRQQISLVSVGAQVIRLLASMADFDLDECQFTVSDSDGNQIATMSFAEVADGLTELGIQLAARPSVNSPAGEDQ